MVTHVDVILTVAIAFIFGALGGGIVALWPAFVEIARHGWRNDR